MVAETRAVPNHCRRVVEEAKALEAHSDTRNGVKFFNKDLPRIQEVVLWVNRFDLKITAIYSWG